MLIKRPTKEIMVNKKPLTHSPIELQKILQKLRYNALIESIGASMRLAGSQISNKKVEIVLTRPSVTSTLPFDPSLPPLADKILELAQKTR